MSKGFGDGKSRGWFSWLRRPGVITAFVVSILTGVILLWVNWLPADPVYQGRKLSVWLQTYDPSSSKGAGSPEWRQADEAVRNMGTNSIPFLLELLREKDSSLKLNVIAFAKRQRFIKIHSVSAATRNIEASRAFSVLGNAAKDAVPELTEIYNENSSLQSKCAIEDVFSWIGPDAKPALPLLLQAATNSASNLRANALWAMGEIKSEPQLCVPVLTQALQDSNDWVQTSAAHALGMFGTNAQSAIPLLKALASPSAAFGPLAMRGIHLRIEAGTALEKIDPTAFPHSEKPVANLTFPVVVDPLDPPR